MTTPISRAKDKRGSVEFRAAVELGSDGLDCNSLSPTMENKGSLGKCLTGPRKSKREGNKRDNTQTPKGRKKAQQRQKTPLLVTKGDGNDGLHTQKDEGALSGGVTLAKVHTCVGAFLQTCQLR
ncbi:hypothetical protein Ancab_019574 [Ancistrocladus abbreviatus]